MKFNPELIQRFQNGEIAIYQSNINSPASRFLTAEILEEALGVKRQGVFHFYYKTKRMLEGCDTEFRLMEIAGPKISIVPVTDFLIKENTNTYTVPVGKVKNLYNNSSFHTRRLLEEIFPNLKPKPYRPKINDKVTVSNNSWVINYSDIDSTYSSDLAGVVRNEKAPICTVITEPFFQKRRHPKTPTVLECEENEDLFVKVVNLENGKIYRCLASACNLIENTL